MEWPSDFQCSPLMDESLFGLFSSSSHELEMMEPKQSEWSDEEKKLFMNALSEIDPTSPAFLENVASRIPWKSIDDIKNHYQSLIDGIQAVESDKVPLPDYPIFDQQQQQQQQQQQDQAKKEGSQVDANVKTKTQRRRGVPWTEEEHQLFLMGLNKYGKGDWRSISRYYVITKTPTQVASHAQKYFRRQTSTTPPDRRRPSIHDIQTVNPGPSIPNFMMNNNNPGPNPAMMFPSDDMMSMMNMMINTNPNFVPADDGHIIFNHNNPNLPGNAGGGGNYGAGASSSSSPFMLPSMMNQPYWG